MEDQRKSVRKMQDYIKEHQMNTIIARLEAIVENVPSRDSRGNSDEEIEQFWTIPVPELLIDEIRKHLPKIRL